MTAEEKTRSEHLNINKGRNMESYLRVWKNFAVFSGRATRTEFWMFNLFSFIITIAIAFVEILAGSGGLIELVYLLAVLIPSLAVTARRLHDIGQSGWLQLIVFIPLFGAVILFFLMIVGSDPGDNRFDANPRGRKKITGETSRKFDALGVTLVNNYHGRGTNVGFGRGSSISDNDVPALASMGLHELYLSRTGIADESIAHLAAMDQLSVLDVSSTNLSRDGIRQLKELLPDAKIIG